MRKAVSPPGDYFHKVTCSANSSNQTLAITRTTSVLATEFTSALSVGILCTKCDPQPPRFTSAERHYHIYMLLQWGHSCSPTMLSIPLVFRLVELSAFMLSRCRCKLHTSNKLGTKTPIAWLSKRTRVVIACIYLLHITVLGIHVLYSGF